MRVKIKYIKLCSTMYFHALNSSVHTQPLFFLIFHISNVWKPEATRDKTCFTVETSQIGHESDISRFYKWKKKTICAKWKLLKLHLSYDSCVNIVFNCLQLSLRSINVKSIRCMNTFFILFSIPSKCVKHFQKGCEVTLKKHVQK